MLVLFITNRIGARPIIHSDRPCSTCFKYFLSLQFSSWIQIKWSNDPGYENYLGRIGALNLLLNTDLCTADLFSEIRRSRYKNILIHRNYYHNYYNWIQYRSLGACLKKMFCFSRSATLPSSPSMSSQLVNLLNTC